LEWENRTVDPEQRGMDENHFVKVFDVLDSGFKDWQFSAFGLIFVAIGAVLFFAPRFIQATGIPFMDFKSKTSWLYRYFFLGFAILWTVSAFLGTFTSYLKHKALVRDNKCKVVEGPVENFVPMPVTGHGDESFSVAGVPFKYSDYIVTDAFNNTASHGGPIDQNSYVRICYDPKGNAILRLEIKDFKGPIGNYGKPELFPDAGSQQNSSDIDKTSVKPFPWYYNLFFILYVLDLIATQNLYLPYIRTFFRIRSAPVESQPIPQTLAANAKIKLRNSTIYWDRAEQTIWLLPRGFNRWRTQLMVARLKSEHDTITSQEVRFSSGIPVVLALFCWTAYRFFSQAMPANSGGPSAAQFVGIVVLVGIIGGFIRLYRDGGRMELLVKDALSELQGM
jgi:hypothetical protein